MCKEVEKVLQETNNEVVACTVRMDGEERTSDDFVAILSKEDGNASIFYNTDALTLGMAMKMIARCFAEAMQALSEEERSMVQEALGYDFAVDKAKED